MTNEYGAPLDRNGYAPSLIPAHNEQRCWMCDRNGSGDPLNRHEIFGGPYREKSKRLGLWVYLCHSRCHQDGPDSVHKSATADRYLKWLGQRAAMQRYGWTTEKFIEEFGKNYLG